MSCLIVEGWHLQLLTINSALQHGICCSNLYQQEITCGFFFKSSLRVRFLLNISLISKVDEFRQIIIITIINSSGSGGGSSSSSSSSSSRWWWWFSVTRAPSARCAAAANLVSNDVYILVSKLELCNRLYASFIFHFSYDFHYFANM